MEYLVTFQRVFFATLRMVNIRCALQLAFKIAIITITINKLLQHFQFLTPMPLSVSYDLRLNTVRLILIF